MIFECEACGIKTSHDPMANKRVMPIGWRTHLVKGQRFLLCDGCGNESNFVGGISTKLKALLERRKGVKFDKND
jgi:hypothetical protein